MNRELNFSHLTLKHESGREFTFSDVVAQYNVDTKENGLTIDLNISEYIRLQQAPVYNWCLNGVTKDGVSVQGLGVYFSELKGSFEHNQVPKLTLRVAAAEFQIEQDGEFYLVDFFVPNVKLGFDKRNKTILEFNYNNIKFNVELKETESETENMLKVSVCTKDGFISFQDAKTLIDMVLDLVTIAYGSQIAWNQVVAYGNKETFEVYREIYENRESIRPLISVRFPGELSSFIGTTFPVYSSLSDADRKALRELVHGIQLSASCLVFPVPFVILGSVIEDFAAKMLPDVQTHFLDKKTRKGLYPEFEKWVEEFVVSAFMDDIDKDIFRDDLKGKFSLLLRRNLRAIIENLLSQYSISYDPIIIGKFVKKRNQSAHGEYVLQRDDYEIWTTMASYLEKIILLSILQYHGDYIDWSKGLTR